MNKRKIYNGRFDRFDSLVFLPFKEEPLTIDTSEDKALLDLIYSVDPKTGLPQGDLAIWLSNKANPEVKSYIQQNLLNELPDEKSVIKIPQNVRNSLREVINDDDIARFSRNHNESSEEYANRLSDFVRSVRLQNQQEREKKRIMKLISNGN